MDTKALILVVVAALVIGTALFIVSILWLHAMPSSHVSSHDVRTTTEPLVASTSSPAANFASWDTYVDPRGRFRFHYPSSMSIGERGESTALSTGWYPVYGIAVGSSLVFTIIDTSDLKTKVASYIDELNSRTSGVDSSPCATETLPDSSSVVTTYACEEYDAYALGTDIGIWMDSFDNGTGNSTTNAILSSIEFTN